VKIILVQHGDAVSGEMDSERPLSATGREQARKAGEFLNAISACPALIVHSGKKRAQETAEIISRALGGVRMEVRGHLNPKDGLERIMAEVQASEASLMVVGHMPFLGRLASSLMGADEARMVVDVAQASPVIFSRSEGRYVLDTYVKNDYLR
jgi:phosphohistidine phosphatase